MSNEIKLLDDDFIKIVKAIEQDILETRFNIIAKANKEVIDFIWDWEKLLVIMLNMEIILLIVCQ